MAEKTGVTISRVGPDGSPGQSVHFDDVKDFTRACREAPRLLRDEMRRDTMRTKAADVREVSDLSLFAWAQQEAQRVAEERRVLADRIKEANDAALELAGTAEQAVLESAKADLKNAREAALEEDLHVAEAKEAVKAARKKVRALAAAQDAKRLKTEAREIEQGVQQRERDLATALAKGEAPRS